MRQIAVILPAALAGADVFVDDADGLKKTPATLDRADPTVATAPFELQIGSDCSEADTRVLVSATGYRPYVREAVPLHAGKVQIRIGVPADTLDPQRRSDTILPPVQLLVATPANALIGKARKVDGVIHDDTGPRLIHGYIDMPAVRIVADDLAEAERTLDDAAEAGRHVLKAACCLCESEDQNNGFWRGRIVLPELARSGALVKLADMVRDRAMKLWLFGSHNFGGSAARLLDFWRWMADALFEAGHADTMLGFEWYSEFPLTSPWGDGDESYVHAAECLKVVRDRLGCLTTMGAPGEDAAALIRTASVGDIVSVDLGRDYSGPDLMHHAHTIYNEGRFHRKYDGGRALLVSTEPTGPDVGSGGDMYVPLEDPEWIFGYQAIFAAYYQASFYFNGAGVRHHVPIIQGYGCREFPRMFDAFLPPDCSTWTGPSWLVRGNQFVIVVARAWDMLGRPPRPVAEWTALFHDGSTEQGTGTIVFRHHENWRTCVVKGTFA